MRPARPTAQQLRVGEAAAWGPRPEASRQLRRARLRKWTPHTSGSLLGFLSVECASRLILNDLRLMIGKNGHWIAMPAVKLLDRDGNPRVDAAGKPISTSSSNFGTGPLLAGSTRWSSRSCARLTRVFQTGIQTGEKSNG